MSFNIISSPRLALLPVTVLTRHRDVMETVPRDFVDQTFETLAPVRWVRIQHVLTRHPNEPLNSDKSKYSEGNTVET